MENKIIEIVCKYYGFEPNEVFIKSRKTEVLIVRQMCQYILKKHTKSTLKDIAMLTRRKQHATVINSIKSIQNWIETDRNVYREYMDICNLIKQPEYFI